MSSPPDSAERDAASISSVESVACPYCGGQSHSPWALERGFHAVRCGGCGLIYVNPRPHTEVIEAAVRSGHHGEEAQHLKVTERRAHRKVARYRGLLAKIFADVWSRGEAISWLDIGAGYGEIVEAVSALAPPGSSVEGVEPMKPKADYARARGLAITEGYLQRSRSPVNIVSLVNVFSHLPSFRVLLDDIRSVLKPGGEVFVETGNLADLSVRDEFPGELGLPDHLVFAGETHMRGFLEQGGFEIVRLDALRVDGVVEMAKNIVKGALGRPVRLGVPYMSAYRQLLIRARSTQ